MQLEPVELDLNLAEALSRNKRRWDAYERLLLDVSRATRRCSCAATR